RYFFLSSRRRHTRWPRDWSSDVCSSDLLAALTLMIGLLGGAALTCLAGARRSASAYDRLRHATLARDVSVQVGGPTASCRASSCWPQVRDVLQKALRLPTVQAAGEILMHPVF